MAYNNYFPQGYYPQQYYTPQNPVQMPQSISQSSNNGVNWVRGGENGANAYPVGAGQSVLLMDADDSVFYIKTVDQSGMPMPLRVFDYSERKSPVANDKATNPIIETDKFVSRDEFENFKSEVKAELKRPVTNRHNSNKEG